MEIARGRTENGTVIGNTTDKYHARNLIVARLMAGFRAALQDLVSATGTHSIHEVGCGEGYWSIHFAGRGYATRGTDFSHDIIEVARRNAADAGARIENQRATVAPQVQVETLPCHRNLKGSSPHS